MEDLHDLIDAEGCLAIGPIQIINIWSLRFSCHEKISCILTLNQITEEGGFYSEIRFVFVDKTTNADITLYQSIKTTEDRISAERIFKGAKNIINLVKEMSRNELHTA